MKLPFKILHIILYTLFAVNAQSEIADSDILFNWAEKQHSQFFSPSDATTQSIEDYSARYYADTDTWLATKDDQVYVYGNIFNNIEPVGLSIKSLGTLSYYLAEIDSSTSSSLVINEIMAKAADGGSDWFELFVTGEDSIYLGDYSVMDDQDELKPIALPDVTLESGQFLVVYATNSKLDTHYVPFKLGSSDSVNLFKNNELVDSIQWQDGDAPSGYSYGRLPDGTGEAQTLKLTPNAANKISPNDSTELVDEEVITIDNSEIFNTDKVVDVYIEIKSEDWQAILAEPQAEEYKPSTITYNGIKLENVAFRTKGNSSLMSVAKDENSTRYSFKVDMDYYEEGQTLLGLKKLNFNNNYSDPSYMREYLSYDLMRYMDLPTPRIAYVNLYINNELHGFYTVIEHVDSVFVDANFAVGDGDLYKPDEGKGSDLVWISDNFSDYSGVELKTNEDSTDNAAFITMLDILNNGTDYESVLNVDNILRYLAVSTAMSNLDSYQGPFTHNYYLYEENGVFSVIPWDFNMSFGGFNNGCSTDEMIGLLIDEPTTSDIAQRPLIDKLLQNPDYLKVYHQHLETLINGPLNPETITQKINDTAALIRDFVSADPSAFYTIEQFELSLTEGFEDLTTEAPERMELPEGMEQPEGMPENGDRFGGSMDKNKLGLQSFIEQRVANIREQLDGTIPSTGDGTGSCTMSGGMGGGFPNRENGGQPPEGFPDGFNPPEGFSGEFLGGISPDVQEEVPENITAD